IAVIEEAARRLSRAMANSGARLDRDSWLLGLLVGGNNSQRLVAGVKHLDRAYDNAAIGVGAGGGKASVPRRLARYRGQAIEIQVVTGERPTKIRAACANPRMQRGRALNLTFLEMVVVPVRQDVELPVRDDVAFIERVFIRMPQGDEFVIALA